MEKPLPDINEPYKSKRSFVFTEKETDDKIIHLMDVKKFNDEVLPGLMRLNEA